MRRNPTRFLHDQTSDTVDLCEISKAIHAQVSAKTVRLSVEQIGAAAVPSIYQFATPRIQIGRALDNDLVLSTMLRKVSRIHAEVYFLGDRYGVCDLGSKCGTFISGQRITEDKPVLLCSGDRIQMSPFLLKFEQVD